MSVLQPFNPKYGSGQNVAPAAASAPITIGKGEKQVRLVNTGAAECYVRLGVAGVVATAADYLVRPGAEKVITKEQDHDTLAHISATGTTLNVMVGEGWN
jgi:hypothetical protein